MKDSKMLGLMVALMMTWTASVCAQEGQRKPTSNPPSQTQEEEITVGEGAHSDHEHKHGGVFGMAGDYHLELVELDAEFRVYLYDAFTKPMLTQGLSGDLVYYAANRAAGQTSGVYETWLPLKPDPANVYLAAAKVPGPEPNEVTVVLRLKGADLEMTFPLRVTLEGRVVDVACFAKQGMAALAREHDECAKMCLMAGSPVGILVGGNSSASVYLVTLRGEGASYKAANGLLMQFASRKVNVTGKVMQRGQLQIVELADVQPAE